MQSSAHRSLLMSVLLSVLGSVLGGGAPKVGWIWCSGTLANCTKYTEDDVRKLARGGAQVHCRL